MVNRSPAIIVMARAPISGEGKTRLRTVLSDQECLNLQEAFVDLTRLINTKEALNDFMARILEGIRDNAASDDLVKQFSLGSVGPSTLPFTTDGLDRLTEILWQKEPSRALCSAEVSIRAATHSLMRRLKQVVSSSVSEMDQSPSGSYLSVSRARLSAPWCC